MANFTAITPDQIPADLGVSEKGQELDEFLKTVVIPNGIGAIELGENETPKMYGRAIAMSAKRCDVEVTTDWHNGTGYVSVLNTRTETEADDSDSNDS